MYVPAAAKILPQPQPRIIIRPMDGVPILLNPRTQFAIQQQSQVNIKGSQQPSQLGLQQSTMQLSTTIKSESRGDALNSSLSPKVSSRIQQANKNASNMNMTTNINKGANAAQQYAQVQQARGAGAGGFALKSALSPDSHMVLAGGSDGQLRIWESISGRLSVFMMKPPQKQQLQERQVIMKKAEQRAMGRKKL
ncbi:MAG: hypothetical protein EZS28_051750, partial [Streblomastix strix]